ncbi:hypothetical protein GOV10_00750 [Candidatus Woesearchaeota archaeon]|nr:hypothetical protein [Candidatus Woesearchaeota archaeon]
MFKLFRKKHYMSWDEYEQRISYWDAITFSQRTRLENIRNIPALGAE